MIRRVLLDAGPLGRIAHPRRDTEAATWLDELLAAGVEIVLPEITDYEVRREFLLARLNRSIRRLDALQARITYLPLTTPVMLRAAELWAQARRAGRPTADPKELDSDVILAAQALSVDGIVATENVGHLSRFVDARHWREITPA